MAKHNIRADMKAEGETLRQERAEPPSEDIGENRRSKMAKGKSGGGKSAGKQKIQAGPSGKMQKFVPVKPQKPGGSAVTNSGGRSGYAK